MEKTKSKRLIALAMTVVVILTCTFAVSAAPANKEFWIRLSSDYSSTRAKIRVTPSNSNGTKGTITILSDVMWYSPCHGNMLVGLDHGTKFTYTISSLKEGGKITLKYVEWTGDVMTLDAMDLHQGGYPNFKTLTGKIHINGSNSFGNIWKIDGFTKNNQKLGIYFRDT